MDTNVVDTGMELRDLLDDPDFLRRPSRSHKLQQPFDAVRRVTQAFADNPEGVLQELVQCAVDCCGADSAGISLEEPDPSGQPTFRWVAIAGSFAQYLNARTPRFFSPCGTCLSTGRAQLFRVTQSYYDFLGVAADPITDGILIPWETANLRGTIWAVAHHSAAAFDLEDYELLHSLGSLAAIILRQQAQAQINRRVERAEASVARAHEMAHQINNPLQSLTNTMYLIRQGGPHLDTYIESAIHELGALSDRVKTLLALPPIESNPNAPSEK